MKKQLLLLAFCASFIQLIGQTDTSKKVDTKVIYFGHSFTKPTVSYNSSAIKLGILDMSYGLFGLHFEHEFGEMFGIQVGIGATGRNYSSAIFAEEYGYQKSSNNFANSATIHYQADANDLFDYSHRTTNSGYFFSITPKIYLNAEGMEGYYLGFTYQYRQYNFTASGIDTTSNGIYAKDASGSAIYTDKYPIAEYENQSIFGITFGSQYLSNKTAIEFSMTGGIRNLSGVRRDVWTIYKYDSNGNSIGSYPVAFTNNENTSQFYFDLSLKIGLWWGKSN